MSIKSKVTRASWVVMVLGLAGLFIVLVVGWLPPPSSAAKTTQSRELQVINRTRAFSVISATPAGLTPAGFRKFDVSLRNDYSKTITAYAVGEEDGNYTSTDFTNVEGIAPGAVVVYHDVARPDRDDAQVIVFAVAFDDGTGDGDPAIIQEFFDARRGKWVQLKRITALLEELSSVPDERFESALEETKSKIKGLPEKEAEKSSAYNTALHAFKELEMDRIEEFQRKRVEFSNLAAREAVKKHLEEKRITIAKLTPPDERK
jgi:hypothetical protein